jgi:outer membrane protein
MKKILILLIGVAMTTAGYAQFTKGTIMAGGSLGGSFNTNKTEAGNTTTTTGTTNTVDFFPQAGYFVIDNLAVGAGIGLSTSTTKAKGTSNKNTVSSTSFAPFARYYYQKFYGQFAFNVGSGNNKNTNGNVTTDNKFTTSGWNLAVGYAYLLNEHIAVEPQIGYASTSQKANTSGNRNINSGLFINIGFQIYLRKK